MPDDESWQDDPVMQDVAILGAIEGELHRQRNPLAAELSRLTTKLTERIDRLEDQRGEVWQQGYSTGKGDLINGWTTINPYEEG